MTDEYLTTLGRVSLALGLLLAVVWLASYFGARAGVTIALSSASDARTLSPLSLPKLSLEATGDGKDST